MLIVGTSRQETALVGPMGERASGSRSTRSGSAVGWLRSRLVHCERQVRSPSWAHNPEVAGSNPAPATRKYQVRGPIAQNGGRAVIFVAAGRQHDRALRAGWQRGRAA